MSSSSSQQARPQQAQNKDADAARKVSYNTKPEQYHNFDGLNPPATRKISQQEHSPERTKKISQQEHSPERTKKISQQEHSPERTKKISQQEHSPERTKKISQQEHSPERTKKISQQEHNPERTKKISQQEHSPERSRRISQYSKEVANTGPSHCTRSQETEKFRRISQYSRSSDEVDVSEIRRKISHYREWAHLKDPIMAGYWRARVGARREHERCNGGLGAPVRLENTYRLEPDVTFDPTKVKSIIKNVLQEHLASQKYERDIMASRCQVLSEVIKERVRQLKLDRFKIVTIVLIGQKKSQAIQVSSRCLWSPDQDNFASSEFSHGDVCAVGMVFAVYQE